MNGIVHKSKLLRLIGDVLVAVADSMTYILGAWLGVWLRMVLYAALGLMAGAMLGEPGRIGGIVLGVSATAEIVIAVVNVFVDTRYLLADLYIAVWWPLRAQAGNDCPRCQGLIPTESREAAREHLRHCDEDEL